METVNLTIRNVPAPVLACLKARAKQHHRSMQGEILAILEEATGMPRRLLLSEAFARMQATGLQSAAEAAALVRADRDGR